MTRAEAKATIDKIYADIVEAEGEPSDDKKDLILGLFSLAHGVVDAILEIRDASRNR